jgi:serine/threonine protein phosphatase PrpC
MVAVEGTTLSRHLSITAQRLLSVKYTIEHSAHSLDAPAFVHVYGSTVTRRSIDGDAFESTPVGNESHLSACPSQTTQAQFFPKNCKDPSVHPRHCNTAALHCIAASQQAARSPRIADSPSHNIIMGNLLGAPVTDKETHSGATPEGLTFGVSTMQGWRVHMEDAHIMEGRLYAYKDGKEKVPLAGHSLFAVMDGHGGTFAAAYAGRNLCRVLAHQASWLKYAQFANERAVKEKTLSVTDKAVYIKSGLDLLEASLKEALVELDREIALALRGARVPDADTPYHPVEVQADAAGAESNADDAGNNNNSNSAKTVGDAASQILEEEGDSGTTVCIVVITPEWIFCANAGDSRAVLSRGGKALPLSYDHKPDDDSEERRIRAAGGYVAGGRVEGDLAVSRGLGDFRFKQIDVVMAGNQVGEASNNISRRSEGIAHTRLCCAESQHQSG